jgi:GTPase Era involved in 16S rRNA processing
MMKNEPAQILEERLVEILELVEKLPNWSCSPQEKHDLKSGIASLKKQLDDFAANLLLIGLLGGTGVGKSTIMNALSGDVISSASHRRPHTHEVILYAHADSVIPGEILNSGIPLIVHRHKADKARHLVLCDVPDFDSIATEHRELVQNFLHRLDLLVWVTSPEKYADEAFYEFLGETCKKKSQNNFYFVLNKIDTVADDAGKLEELAVSFAGYLTGHGIESPRIFLVSALDAVEKRPSAFWNQWHLFEREIFRERQLKEIHQIKHSNFMRELEQIEQEVSRAAEACVEASDHIRAVKEELLEFLPDWEREGKRIAKILVGREAVERFLADSFDVNRLKGTAYLIARAARMGRRVNGEEIPGLMIPESTRRPFSALSDKLNRVLHLRSVPEQLFNEISELYASERLWAMWKDKVSLLFEEEREKIALRGSMFFGFFQNLSYWTIAVIFILSLGEFRYPAGTSLWGWVGERVLRFFEKIFTLEGLGALLSLLILETFVGYFFFRLYRKSLQERAQRVIEGLTARAVQVWKDLFMDLVSRLASREESYGSWGTGILKRRGEV